MITGNDEGSIKDLKNNLKTKFEMKDSGVMQFLLGI